MGKLLKYEIMRSRYWFILTAAVVLLAQALILAGDSFSNETLFTFGASMFAVCGFFGVFGLLVFSVMIFSSDISKKHGYMVFLTPRNAYQIVGAKLLLALIALVLGFTVYTALALWNFSIATHDVQFLTVLLKMIPEKLTPSLIALVFNLLFEWFVLIITVYFAIALSNTLFAKLRVKGLLSVVIFLLINWGISWLSAIVLKGEIWNQMNASLTFFDLLDRYGQQMLLSMLGINAFLGVCFYLGTSFLVEKKLSM